MQLDELRPPATVAAMGVLPRWSVMLLVLLWLLPGSPARATASQEDHVSRENAVGIVACRRDTPAAWPDQADAEDEQPFVPPGASRVRATAVDWAVAVSSRVSFGARTRAFVVGIPRGPPHSV